MLKGNLKHYAGKLRSLWHKLTMNEMFILKMAIFIATHLYNIVIWQNQFKTFNFLPLTLGAMNECEWGYFIQKPAHRNYSIKSCSVYFLNPFLGAVHIHFSSSRFISPFLIEIILQILLILILINLLIF